MQLDPEQQTQEAIAELVSRKVADKNNVHLGIRLYVAVEFLKSHRDLVPVLTPEVWTEAINQELEDATPWSAADILDLLDGQPQVQATVLESLANEARFAPPNEGHEHGYLLEVFSNYPQLHPAIHEIGLKENKFAMLLTDRPQSEYRRYPVLELTLTDTGFVAEGIIATSIGLYDAPVPRVFANWVHTRFKPWKIPTTRDELLGYYVPKIVDLMTQAATSATVPASLRTVAARQIEGMRLFLKPRGVII